MCGGQAAKAKQYSEHSCISFLQHAATPSSQVLDQYNGITLGDCPNKLRKEFYAAYADDPEMAKVDAFLCNHACGMCELFMPFNKSLIVIASTR